MPCVNALINIVMHVQNQEVSDNPGNSTIPAEFVSPENARMVGFRHLAIPVDLPGFSKISKALMSDTEKRSGAKTAPQWNHLEKRFHFVKVEPFFP